MFILSSLFLCRTLTHTAGIELVSTCSSLKAEQGLQSGLLSLCSAMVIELILFCYVYIKPWKIITSQDKIVESIKILFCGFTKYVFGHPE